jgi:16S rRNA (guanine527-N7)-methyltransferase
MPHSPAQQAQIEAYLALLQRWNKHYNLSAVRDAAAMRVQHIADCLAILPALRRELSNPAGELHGRWLDAGSGGGLPGVLLAIMAPGLEVHCADAVGKKAAFVTQVAAELKLPNLRGLHARVEELPTQHYSVAISRAFASLADFCTWTSAAIAEGGRWVAMKGQLPHDEIAALPRSHRVFHVEQIGVPGLDAQRCLVWIERTG